MEVQSSNHWTVREVLIIVDRSKQRELQKLRGEPANVGKMCLRKQQTCELQREAVKQAERSEQRHEAEEEPQLYEL